MNKNSILLIALAIIFKTVCIFHYTFAIAITGALVLNCTCAIQLRLIPVTEHKELRHIFKGW